MKEAASLQPAVLIVTVTALGSAFEVLGSTLGVPAARVAASVMQELWFKRLEDGEERVDENRKEQKRGRSYS